MSPNIKGLRYCVISKCNGEKASYAKLELEKYIFLLTGAAPNKQEDKEECDITFRVYQRCSPLDQFSTVGHLILHLGLDLYH